MRTIALALVVASAAPSGAAGITYIPRYQGTWSWGVEGISDDGSTILGATDYTSFTWSKTVGFTTFRVPGQYLSRANVISGDGSKVAGFSFRDSNSQDAPLFRYATDSAVAESLGIPESYRNFAAPLYISNDGKTILLDAMYNFNADRPYIWREGMGFTVIPGVIGYENGISQPCGITTDHRYVYGTSTGFRLPGRIFRWSEGGGVENLGSMYGDSKAYAMTSDGQTIIGSDNASGQADPFIWREGQGFFAVSRYQGLVAELQSVSTDGRTFYGDTAYDQRHLKFVYRDGQFQDLTAYLSARGVDMTGVNILDILHVTPDANNLLCRIWDPVHGESNVIISVPEPSTFLSLGVFLVAVTARRRRKSELDSQ